MYAVHVVKSDLNVHIFRIRRSSFIQINITSFIKNTHDPTADRGLICKAEIRFTYNV